MERSVITLSFSELVIETKEVGDDLLVLVSGGEKPHLGCTVLAQPRESLSGDGSISCTSSVLNVVGHKDETICRALAEAYCKAKNRTVVCTGGFHCDNITEEQIKEVLQWISEESRFI